MLKRLLLLVLLTPIILQARPVSYPGGYTIIQDNDYIANSLWIHYSPTSDDSFGARIDYLRENNAKLYTAQYTRLLKRWNLNDSQANVYLMGGLGSARVSGTDNFTSWAGVSSDFETRRWFLQYKNRFTHINNTVKLFHNRARIGYAPYEASYEDIQPWVMLQVDKVNFMRITGQDAISNKAERLVFTPMLRLFKGRYLAELGVSSEETVMFNWIVRY